MTEHRTLGWDPARTWVFVVGTLEWKYSEYFSSFPHENRRDAALVDLFGKLGVPAAQICYLQDRQATLQQIQQAFERQLAAVPSGSLLVLYYCGHGSKTDDGAAYFVAYDSDGEKHPGWMVESIPATIDRHFGGARALLLADCCYSGSLADAIGARSSKIAYACLASSLASELSTGNWTFTEALLAGLAGQAMVDANGDRTITLREMATQLAESMAFAEEQISTFTTSGGFDADMVLAPAQPRPDPRVGQGVEVQSGSSWYLAQIIDARAGELKVHYYGYEASDDEWVTDDRIRSVKRKTYPVGAQIEVKWKRSWYPATVLEVRSGIHHIHYSDYSSDWDEWVASKRIRAAS